MLAEEYGNRVPHIVREVSNRDVGAKYSDIVFSTGHKAKGMEFPVVELAQDFVGMITAHKAHPEQHIVNEQEINLLYVAITRATRELHLNPAIVDFIERGTY